MERTAIFPGSFDPFTRGHAALVEEALNLFDRVVIGIGNNTAKQGLLTVGNRKRLIDDIYARNPRVEARVYTGLTGEFAEQMGACAIIRGVVEKLYHKAAADAMTIQYGGSMKPGNAKELLEKEDVDGGLIGGAALKAQDFAAIVEAAK